MKGAASAAYLAPMTLLLTARIGPETHRWPLERGPLRIGRAPGNALTIADPTVSREHAELLERDGAWTVLDLGSRNGTRVNGIAAERPLPLQVGDRLEVGQVVIEVSEREPQGARFVLTREQAESSLYLPARDVLRRTDTGDADTASLLPILAEVGRLLALPRPLAETCETLLDPISRAVAGDRFVLLLRDPSGGDPQPVATRERSGRTGGALVLSRTLLGMVLDEGAAIVTGDTSQDPRLAAQASIVGNAIRSAMAVPLVLEDRILGILYVDSADPGVGYGERELTLFTLLGNMAAVRIENARLLVAEQARQRLAQEAATAARIQRALLTGPPALPGWSGHARLETCYEVGGDLHDFHLRPDGTLVVLVGDVSGKGMGAAMLMSSLVASARALYDTCDGPLDLVRRLNAVLHRGTGGRDFVTLFVGWLDPTSGALRYVNAGHPEPHRIGPAGAGTLTATGIPVGMLPDFPWTEDTTTLAAGDQLAIFSDGIPEAQRGDEFFDDARVTEAMQAAAAAPDPERGAQVVFDRVEAFMDGGPRTDDVTLVLLRRA